MGRGDSDLQKTWSWAHTNTPCCGEAAITTLGCWLEKQVLIYSSKHSKQRKNLLKLLTCLAVPAKFCSESGGTCCLECCAPTVLPTSSRVCHRRSPGTVTLTGLNHSLTQASSCATHPKGRSLKQSDRLANSSCGHFCKPLLSPERTRESS